MGQEPLTYSGMHAEHRQWQSDHSMWNDDAENWREQYQSVLAQLSQLETLVRQHGQRLEEHVEATQRLQHSLEQHEKSMAGYLREGQDAEGQEAMCKNHRQKAERHAEQRQLHEQFKKSHHTLMAHCLLIKAAIDAEAV